jgi:hypothetical protein
MPGAAESLGGVMLDAQYQPRLARPRFSANSDRPISVLDSC